MRFDDDFDNDYEDEGFGSSKRAPIIYMTVIVSLFVLVILEIVIVMNKKSGSNKGSDSYSEYVAAQSAEETEAPETTEHKDNLTADDLDFWDMYPEREDDRTVYQDDPDDAPDKSKGKPLPTPTMPVSDEEKYNDGKHFKITYRDGSEEWLAIDPAREKNNYTFTNMVKNDGKMKYVLEGKTVSFLGIDVSRYQKDIDFYQIKNAGIDYVMIRVGARGYQSGLIALDENFVKNITGAIEAGLDVGVYFYSQAINQQEAIEEANMVVDACKDYKLKYPVAFDMEFVENDRSRIESLSKEERTLIAAAFINRIIEAGYKPMIYGDEEWLEKRVDVKNLIGTSIWLADESDMPDYPYQYSMWQYSTKGELYGIDGPVNMDICFIDYSAR